MFFPVFRFAEANADTPRATACAKSLRPFIRYEMAFFAGATVDRYARERIFFIPRRLRDAKSRRLRVR